jgi:hypothetical protein
MYVFFHHFRAMATNINTQIRKLPYGTLQKLERYLEPASDKDWKALISVMPQGRYDRSQVGDVQTLNFDR